MCSFVALQGVSRAGNYLAIKANVQSFADGLAIELKVRGGEVLAFAPGPEHSCFEERAGMAMKMGQPHEEVARKTLAILGRKTTASTGYHS